MCVTLPRVLVTLVGIEKIVPVDGRSRGVPPAAAAVRDRRADESVQLHLDRNAAARRSRGVPRRPARQRSDERPGRSGVARDTALHPLRGMPERLPGLPSDRRARLRVDLQRTDRRHPDAAAAVDGTLARHCRTRPRCVARATRCVRSRSTSPRSSFICGAGSSRQDPPRGEGLAMRAASLASRAAAGSSLAQRLGRLAQWPFVDGREDPVAARRRLPDGRRRGICLPIPAQTFREWWAAASGTDEGRRMIERSGARADIFDAIRRAVPPRRHRAATRTTRQSPGDYVVTGRSIETRTACVVQRTVSSTTTSASTMRRRSRCRPRSAAACVARGKRRMVVPDGIPGVSCCRAISSSSPDVGLSYDELDRCDGVVTMATIAIAMTGTIVLTHNGGRGPSCADVDPRLSRVRRAAPIRSSRRSRRRFSRLAAIDPALVTTISGPSATADIEMIRVRGVHGPRTLDVSSWSGKTRRSAASEFGVVGYRRRAGPSDPSYPDPAERRENQILAFEICIS